MARIPFGIADFEQECRVELACYQLDSRALGLKIYVPEALRNTYPFNASAYALLQQLREQIFEFGTVEFPGLPVNRANHTLAQRAPWEHGYSSNTYMTDHCQQPHQDTPPYPTGFWLEADRQYFSTWVLSLPTVNGFFEYARSRPQMTVEELHRELVPCSLADHSGILLNQQAGLLLIDNSECHQLFHARTCNFERLISANQNKTDSPMYAFSEIGLMNYIDELDSRRGDLDRDAEDKAETKAFMDREGVPSHGKYQ